MGRSFSSLDDSLTNRAAPPGSMRYFALLYTPEERREVVMALFAIDAEIRESAQSVNHDVAHTRLAWWRGEVDRLVNGVPQHPAMRVLQDQHRGERAAFAKLHEPLVAADMDLARMTYENTQELRAYCSRSGGAIQELVARQLSARGELDEPARSAANSIGASIRATEIVRDLTRDARDGHIYLPLEHLERFTARPEELAHRELGPNAKAALQSFTQGVQEEIRSARSAAEPHESLRPLAVLAALHQRLLDRIAARNYDVASERVELGPIEKPWIAWREARKAK